jgi:hypothetical protein
MIGRLRMLVPTIAAIALAGLPLLSAAQTPAPAPTAPVAATPAAERSLDVTVTYSGKGEVSTTHEVSIFLFTEPNITEASMPIAVGTVEMNGGHFAFADLPPVVYIAVVYDETGNYNREGPPPPGTPVSIHGMTAGAPEGVKSGKDAKVAVTFDDSNRM